MCRAEHHSNLEPGGWAEFQDWDTRLHCIDDTLKPDSELVKWTELGTEAMVKLKREHLPGPKLKQWMSEAGFKDVRSEVVTLPLGPWPKDPKLVRHPSPESEGLDLIPGRRKNSGGGISSTLHRPWKASAWPSIPANSGGRPRRCRS